MKKKNKKSEKKVAEFLSKETVKELEKMIGPTWGFDDSTKDLLSHYAVILHEKKTVIKFEDYTVIIIPRNIKSKPRFNTPKKF